jgi:hypothetical protein
LRGKENDGADKVGAGGRARAGARSTEGWMAGVVHKEMDGGAGPRPGAGRVSGAFGRSIGLSGSGGVTYAHGHVVGGGGDAKKRRRALSAGGAKRTTTTTNSRSDGGEGGGGGRSGGNSSNNSNGGGIGGDGGGASHTGAKSPTSSHRLRVFADESYLSPSPGSSGDKVSSCGGGPGHTGGGSRRKSRPLSASPYASSTAGAGGISTNYAAAAAVAAAAAAASISPAHPHGPHSTFSGTATRSLREQVRHTLNPTS